jgi:hypothetical protein
MAGTVIEIKKAVFGSLNHVYNDDIRQEQNFQLSGDVSDDSAVSIGHMIGANVVIVGSITTITSRGRITIRALDVETGEVIAIVSDQF